MINFNQLKLAAKTATFRQSIITVVSTVFNGGLATIYYLLVARILGSGQYGLFVLATATIAIMSSVFDFGNDRGMVKFMSKYPPEESKGRQVMKFSFLTKMASSLFFVCLFFLFPAAIAKMVFNQPGMTGILPLTGLAFAAQLFFYFPTYYFQAREKFVWWGFMFVGTNFFRLLLAAIAAVFGRLDALMALVLFTVTPFVFFLIGMSRIGWGFLSENLDRKFIREIFSFNRWTFGFSAVSAVSSRLDTYITSYFSKISDVGVYGLATQATMIMPNLVSAVGAVTGPKFSRFGNPGENKKYLEKSMLFFGGIALASGILLIPLGLVFMLISGTEYLSGFVPFLLLILSQVIFFALAPLRDSILYYHSRPNFFFWAGIGHGLITLGSGLFLLPRFGLVGASLSNLLGQLFLNSAAIWYYRRIQVKLAEKPHD